MNHGDLPARMKARLGHYGVIRSGIQKPIIDRIDHPRIFRVKGTTDVAISRRYACQIGADAVKIASE